MSLEREDMTQVNLATIYELAKRSKPQIIVVDHWSAGRYSQFFPDYDIQIDHDATIWMPDLKLDDIDTHVWRRNTGAVGVCIPSCYGATTNDLGEYPPTDAAIDMMCQVNAVLLLGLDLDLEDCKTHGEVAEMDDYGLNDEDPDMRWDLAKLRNEQALEDGYKEIADKTRFYYEKFQREGIPGC